MAALTAVVDTGPVYAAADRDDRQHEAALDALSGVPHLTIPPLVVAEAAFLIGSRMGPEAEAAFFAGLSDMDVHCPPATDWLRVSELVRQHADFPLGGADASVVATAERMRTETVITFDRRHFQAVVPRHCAHLRLLP